MAQHKVIFNIPERELGNADIEFKVKKNGTVFGTLKVSKGKIEWVSKDHTYGRKLSWNEFDALMKESDEETPTKVIKAAEPIAKKTTSSKTFTTSKYRRHANNPFRAGSGYALAWDILASHPHGINRTTLITEYANETHKPLKNAEFDIHVVLSPKSEEPTSKRHSSCREGYGIRKTNEIVQIVMP